MSEQDAEQRAESVAVHRIEFSVDWPPGHVAAYLVDCAEPILFDAGMAGEDAHEELVAGLADSGYDLADVDHLVVTHPHVDHIGQVPAIVETADPEVYAPAGVDERFDRDPDELAETVEQNAKAAGLRGEYLDEAVEMSVESLERDGGLLSPDYVDHWVDGGTEIDIGPLTFETTHTPGHQADHLVFQTEFDGERRLFAGDMALATFRPVAMHTGFDDGYDEAIDAYYTGVDRLAELTVDRVYPGHGPVHADFDDAIADDRESLDHLLERSLEMLDDDGKTAVDVAFQRKGDRDIRYLVIETTSALAKLDRDGEASSTLEDGVRRFTVA
ncbi:MBL fold metallo-hydrolase [Halorientalis brevis]|uniref:MBL fold metallo-hydrolase n=1 Tax=Halorientalis brevis TaxID=1126241 RepID=A0ABD6CB30_9EURY|nr:MBL fold metallo-hydrolase [Halorientalis brevis]